MNLICGINPVLEALEAGERHFDRLLVVKGLRNRRVSDAIGRASQMGIPLRFEGRETLDRMAGGLPHQGIVAVVSSKPVLTMESLLDQAREPALIVVLDGVEDPRNLGAIVRTAEAAGVDGVLLPQRHSAGLSETVSRASAGALEHVKVARVVNVSQALEALKARGVWVVGLDAAGTERWDAVDLKRPVALVLGGEGRGMRRLVRERCDHLVSLPMFGHVGSLNVAVAAGIALYEVVRQRGAVPSHVRPIPSRAGAGAHGAGHGEQPWHRSDPEAAGGDEEHDDGPNVLLHEEEEPWWGAANAAPAPRERRPAGRHPQGKHRSPRHAPGPPPTGDATAEAPAAPAPGEGAPARRRRRRKGRRDGRPAEMGPGAEAAPPPATEAAAAPAPGPNAPGARRRFRRRRRR